MGHLYVYLSCFSFLTSSYAWQCFIECWALCIKMIWMMSSVLWEYFHYPFVAQMVTNMPTMPATWVWSLGRRIPWRRARVWMAEIVYFSGWCWGTRWKLGVLLSLSSVQPLEGPTCEPRQKERGGNSQWLSHLASTAGGPGLIPAQKTKFLHARRGGWRKQQQNKLSKKEKQ